jgi:hypothetical protein
MQVVAQVMVEIPEVVAHEKTLVEVLQIIAVIVDSPVVEQEVMLFVEHVVVQVVVQVSEVEQVEVQMVVEV